MIYTVSTLEDCLKYLGSEEPFFLNEKYSKNRDNLTESGIIAYNKLREILFFMQQQNIINSFNEDKLDEISNFQIY